MSVWIQFIFAKIENWNWKHYSEIIFKFVNSAVKPIFNEKVIEKCNLRDPWTVHGCIVHSWLVNNCGLKQKKKKKKKKEKGKKLKTWTHNQTRNPNCTIDILEPSTPCVAWNFNLNFTCTSRIRDHIISWSPVKLTPQPKHKVKN